MRDTEKVFKNFTKSELDAAFDRVSDPKDWRAPIAATCTTQERETVAAAIEFFTGTTPTFEPDLRDSKTWKVTAIGYRNGPCGP